MKAFRYGEQHVLLSQGNLPILSGKVATEDNRIGGYLYQL